jgi:preprotein translocase subunit SecF
MSRFGNLGARLYRGEASYDFIGKRKVWYLVSGILIVLSIAAFFIRGLDYGIEFEGGAVFTADAPAATVPEARAAVEAAGVEGIGEPIVTKLSGGSIRVQTLALTTDESAQIVDSLAEELGIATTDIQRQLVGPSWGQEITKKAFTGLAIFLILVAIYLAMAFEWKMAVAAIIALLHDLTITAGIYALVGFEVTPATVIGLLTILGYSLYDTVVVFDKVRENTRGILGSNRWTYGQATNLAVNQTLVRSINTSIVALLPVLGLLVGGVVLIGAGALNDLALVLFVGMAVGTYSSIFIASPLLVQLKEAEPAIQAQGKRVRARQTLAGATAAAAGTGGAIPVAVGGELPGREAAAVAVPTTRNVVAVGARAQPKKVSRERRAAPPPKKKR